MAFSHNFDPARGFVALPCDIMEIDMSPGAFRLLVELCRMANRSGECWPSLGQLSDRIGRSRAAISGYIAELRALELVETVNQRMANGYNYRLKYCVTFWQSWRAGLSAPKAERSVQPVERRVNSKNHIQKNQTPARGAASDTEPAQLVSVFSKWSDLSRNAPFPGFNRAVPQDLVHQTRHLLRGPAAQTLAPGDLSEALKRLWTGLGVELTCHDLAFQVKALGKACATQNALVAFEAEVKAIWERHWKKPPNAHQFGVLLNAAQKRNRDEGMRRVLTQYLKRWEISQNKLHAGGASPSLTEKQAA